MRSFLLKGNRGMVLVIVIVAIMLMAIVVVGILSRNISGALVDERGRQRFQAEYLAKGGFWRAHQSQIGGGGLPASFNEVMNGTTYAVTFTFGAPGPLGTTEVLTQVTY